MEWQPRNCKRSQGWQRISWRDEIVAYAGGMKYINVRQRKVEGDGKGLCPGLD